MTPKDKARPTDKAKPKGKSSFEPKRPGAELKELLERAREMEARGEDIVHMEIGEPDFATPECIKDAAIQAIRENHTSGGELHVDPFRHLDLST